MLTEKQIVDEVNRFIKVARWSPSRFGKEAVGDPHLVFQIRKGRKMLYGTARSVIMFIDRQRRQLKLPPRTTK